MRHGFVLVLFVVLFTVDDSLASVLEQYVFKDGREQCEEIKPYCSKLKPRTKRKKTPPPKVKAKKKCKRQYRLRPSNRCPFVRRPSCKKTVTVKKVVDQIVKNPQPQNEPPQCAAVPLQKGFSEASLLLKETTTAKPTHVPKKPVQPITAAQMPLEDCKEELPKVTIPCEVPKKPTPSVPSCERSKPCNCIKKISFNEDGPSSRPKCVKCPAELARTMEKIPPTAVGINCDNRRSLMNKEMTDTISPHFGHHDMKAGLLGLGKKQTDSDNIVLEVKVPTLTQIARMGWNFVTFTTDQCFNVLTKIHEARARKRQRIC